MVLLRAQYVKLEHTVTINRFLNFLTMYQVMNGF